jgi:hypothetical protein
MPIFNLVKNCTYYWAFGAYVSYFVNHPLYTSPDPIYSLALFALAMVCQASNFRCVPSVIAPHPQPNCSTSQMSCQAATLTGKSAAGGALPMGLVTVRLWG